MISSHQAAPGNGLLLVPRSSTQSNTYDAQQIPKQAEVVVGKARLLVREKRQVEVTGRSSH